MIQEDQAIWTLNPAGRQRLNVIVQNFRALNGLTLKRLVEVLHFPGDFRTLDHYLNGRSPWQPGAVKAALQAMAKIRYDFKFTTCDLPGELPEEYAACWVRHLANPTLDDSYPLDEAPDRRRWKLSMRHADRLFNRIKAYESRAKESLTIATMVPAWAMPNRLMKQHHVDKTKYSSANPAVLNYFERSRFRQYVHSEVSCRRTFLISESCFMQILNGHSHHHFDPPLIFEPRDLRDYIFLLHDCANRQKLRLGFFQDIALDPKLPDFLFWALLAEHTFIGDRFYFEGDGWSWRSAEEEADGMTVSERVQLRNRVTRRVMPNLIPSLDTAKVAPMLREPISKLNQVLFTGLVKACPVETMAN